MTVKKKKRTQKEKPALSPLSVLGIVIFIVTILNLLSGQKLFSVSVKKVSPPLSPVPSLIPPGKMFGGENAYVEMAVKDLTSKTNAADNSITVLSVTPKEFPNAGLGCPEPGKIYAQIIANGYEIILEYQGNKIIYHAGLNKVVSC